MVGSWSTGRREAMSPGRGLSWRYSRYQPDHCRAGRLAPQGAGCEHYMGSGSGMPPRQKRRLSYPVGGHARSLLASSADLAVRAGAGLFGIADLIDVPAGVTDWRAHYGLVPTSFLSRARAMGSRWRCNPCARRSRHSRRCESAWSLPPRFPPRPRHRKDLALLGGE